MSGNLIIYYSRKGENYVGGDIVSLKKGNTEYCAEYVAEATGGDLFEIETVREYPEDYYECIDEAKHELQQKARPELKRYLNDISSYDNIFICGPCWWGLYPMPVYSLLERLDLTDKKVMCLVTHEGSGLASCEKGIRDLCQGAVFGKALAVQGSRAADSKDKIVSWAGSQI